MQSLERGLPARVLPIVGTGRRLTAHARDPWRRLDLQALRSAKRKLCGRPVVAHQAHIASGCQRRLDTAGRIADDMSAGHRQVVTENNTVKLQFVAQNVLQPAL